MASTPPPAPRQWLLTGAHLATMRPGGASYGLIPDGALAIDGKRIAWAGAANAIPNAYAGWPAERLDGGLITPALIDCHTHIVHGGERSGEWERRLLGESYAGIARSGGGILATVTATRAASEDELVTSARTRLDDFIAQGLGAIEIKSGYGLDLPNERKMLRAARRLGEESGIVVKTSFLGAHALPPEYAGRSDAYIDLVVEDMLPAIAEEGLADYCDGFCESIAFGPAQMRKVLQKAKSLGMGLRLHAEQLSNSGGAAMAAQLGALSCDHLEYLDEDGVRAMVAAGTVAVLLPGAFYFLQERRKPPMALLRDAGVAMALASDCNPGSSPLTSLLLAMNMGCTLFGLTPEEALAGVTREAAAALGLATERGTLEAGKVADLALWDVDHPARLAYALGANPHLAQIRAGQWLL